MIRSGPTPLPAPALTFFVSLFSHTHLLQVISFTFTASVFIRGRDILRSRIIELELFVEIGSADLDH